MPALIAVSVKANALSGQLVNRAMLVLLKLIHVLAAVLVREYAPRKQSLRNSISVHGTVYYHGCRVPKTAVGSCNKCTN